MHDHLGHTEKRREYSEANTQDQNIKPKVRSESETKGLSIGCHYIPEA
jgi:hypothetical protein